MTFGRLEIIVFVCGACTMILELLGSRILAPYLGTSVYVWTSLIGVILAALSAGYWIGGFIADKNPKAKVLSLILFFSGLTVGLTAVFSDLFVAGAMLLVKDARGASILAALFLFGLPSVSLGMVLPLAVRLKLTCVDQSGRTVGLLYALSTVGSILGTFLTGFFLVAYFEISRTLLIVSAMLFVLSVIAYRSRWAGLKVFFLVGLVLLQAQAASCLADGLKGSNLLDFNTRYSRVWIYDTVNFRTGFPVRIMQVNDEYDSAMYLGRSGLVFDYTKYFRLLPHFCPDFRKILMIGGAAYSYPKDYLEHFTDRSIDVVEIDPGVTSLAKKYFGLKDDPGLRIIHEDARVFLNQNTVRYDAILCDAFKSYSVPYQLTTLEAARRMDAALNSDGAVIMNIICALEGPSGRFLRAEAATFNKVFPQVFLFAIEDRDDGFRVQNWILVALKSKTIPKFYSRDSEIHALLQHLWIKQVADDVPVLTDAFAPTDRYMVKIAMSTTGWQVNPVVKRLRRLMSL